MGASWYVALALLLAVAAIALAVSQSRAANREQRLIEQRLGGGTGAQDLGRWSSRTLERLSGSGLGRRLHLRDNEVRQLLTRAGWSGNLPRSLYQTLQVATPLLLCLLVVLFGVINGRSPDGLVLPLVFAGGIGFLLPKRVLAHLAGKRSRKLAEETIVFIQLIRILFDAGLTVEQALRVVQLEGRGIVPVLAEELGLALGHADSGLDLAEELEQLSRRMQVSELTDCCGVLRQMLRQGGSARASLMTLKELFEDRRLTSLQEKIGKLSAKMSLVMIALLFPALLIILAGPGFMAITKALGGIR
ncbi:type II secretion system F family protein [Pseudomonas citronellolis]|uniref:type II secretion system F family protein n=1 Tax=Pseudomonas citronellolis TaxID=53408 RepID=UPI0023E3CF93|nr:type II secretion system F family protein [Pseudomonas citronellolis]MDF3932647.1 type II secretion system F family protein [Pseudomonas citronellolis]